MIKFEDVVFWYRKDKPFGPFNLQFESGKVNVIIGANGAGKSTLIQLILGRIHPKSGVLNVVGNISYMPDDLLFPRYLKVKEIITLLANYKHAEANQINAVLNSVGLLDQSNDYVKSFSKGMVQRVNIAQSLLGNADTLIMDEPTNGLDPNWIYKLTKIIDKEKELGKTIIISTHQLDFALKVADKIMIMKDRRLLNVVDNQAVNESELRAYYQ
ncbi:ATP-binding cassette domain-containing protein [Macrococcus sp. DPC7161]|uniref:ATP-binding cassette domain-containing protein n=1 Tax=Macrococcus sp. DPC7161 TaxID=2507060 RepID=UPI00100A2AEB|nr:ABC transporter ATP-binding protein [Macrococcus sp. DPC7161]RXK18497.1 ABC transporter ATP-binding protein [Macrococcus sp. DPC7161]